MITAIIQFFRWVGFRNFLTFALIIVVFFLIKNRFFGKTDGQIEVTSLFQKIEYVENLRLVSYYYEEIVAIGTSDRLQKLVNRAKDKVENSRRAVIFAELNRDSLKIKMERAIEAHESIDSTLIRIENDFLALSDSLDKYDYRTFNKFGKLSRQRHSSYGQAIQVKLSELRQIERLIPSTPRRRDRQDMKQRQKELEAEILTILERKRKVFKQLLDSKKQVLQQMGKQSKIVRKELKQVKKQEEERFQDASQEVLKLRGELEKNEENLKDATEELQKLDGNPLPKLLVVVTAEVTGMVDLKQMKVETISADSLTVLHMPSAITDSVQIRMSDTKRFLANNSKEGIFSSGEEGLYYEVYQQLKDAMTETESRVRKKAIEAGILDQTNELAREYISNVAKSTGFKAGFAPTPEPIVVEGENTVNPDSLDIVTDSIQIILKNAEQKDRSISRGL